MMMKNLKERINMEELFSIAIERFQKERPEVELTTDMRDAIWYSICGELNRNGKEAAWQYVKTARLL